MFSGAPLPADAEAARALMVDGQIRPNRVYDTRILAAMRTLPRERFLPPALAGLAYLDADVKLANGRVFPAPLTVARLVQLAAPREGERALVVGAGTGYGAALLAACGASVTALEEDEALRAIAGPALAGCAPQVRLVAGALADGFAEGGPWDIIVIEGAVCSIPERIGAQLRAETGRLVAVLMPEGETGRVIIAEQTPAGLGQRAAFGCATAYLPAFRPRQGFRF